AQWAIAHARSGIMAIRHAEPWTRPDPRAFLPRRPSLASEQHRPEQPLAAQTLEQQSKSANKGNQERNRVQSSDFHAAMSLPLWRAPGRRVVVSCLRAVLS